MTAHELLNVLNKRVIKGTIPGEDLVQDLNELLQRFDDANYCRIIRRALEWAAIYDSQDKCERWGRARRGESPSHSRHRNCGGGRCEVGEMNSASLALASWLIVGSQSQR